MLGPAADHGAAGDVIQRLHGTCVAICGAGVLLRGSPGAGKSDLAFRIIAEPPPGGQPPAYLVADDQVALSRSEDQLIASAPDPITGLMEIRGVGIRRVPSVATARVALIIDLATLDAVPRLPPQPLPTEDVLGISLPVAKLAPFEPSAPLKLRALLGAWSDDPACGG